MAAGYKVVLWNRNKVLYDVWLFAGIVAFLGLFFAISLAVRPAGEDISPPIILIRAFGFLAFVMLTVILMIGPLARLNKRFLPLLYNRRHFGVLTFVIALVHFAVATGWYHGFGEVNPFVSIFTSNAQYGELQAFPFEIFGFLAFVILYVMAATSHDFWLANLSAPVWKALHMGVYIAYAALVLHIAFGILQSEVSPAYWALVITSVVLVTGLHWIAGGREVAADAKAIEGGDTWREVCTVDAIPMNRAKIVPIRKGESVAIFRYENKISAVTNACRHQNGPLGEGKVIDGCITCPWHGYQYRPEDGTSPPPFTEKIETYKVKVENGMVFLNPTPFPPGTFVEPAVVTGG